MKQAVIYIRETSYFVKQKCVKSTAYLTFNFFLASQKYHYYSENVFPFWNKICPKYHTSKLCVSLFDITQRCDQLLTRNRLLILQ